MGKSFKGGLRRDLKFLNLCSHWKEFPFFGSSNLVLSIKNFGSEGILDPSKRHQNL